MQPVGWTAYVALLISGIALVFAVRNFQRKAGIYLRGSFSIASNRACEDRYVREIVLENLKDRAVCIFEIYLRVGYSVYIEIETFEEQPLVLKPFEIYRKRFGPIEFYGFNMRRVDVNVLLANDKVRKRIVLNTSEGKYIVADRIRGWNPVVAFFNNHLTAILRPIPSRYKETDLGSNIKYVVEVIPHNGATEVVPVSKDDHNLRIFKNFVLTESALETKEALELFLLQQQIDGTLLCKDVRVHDVDIWRQSINESYKQRVSVDKDSWFRYHVFGRIGTWIQTRTIRRQNKSLQKANRDSV